MNTDDHEAPERNRQVAESDVGPDPDWLTDDDVQETQAVPEEPEVVAPAVAEFRPIDEPIEAEAVAVASAPALTKVRKPRAWLWWAAPLAILVVTAFVAWFGSTQGLNDLTTWSALRFQHPALLPARWSMLIWWIVLPLLAMFLIYSALPAGKEITRIKRTGPLLSVGLISAIVWIFAQHWRWEEVSLVAVFVGLAAILACYLMVALNQTITHKWQRVFAVVPLSATLGFSVMLLTISWQGYSTQPFGARGTSILFLLLLLVIAAVFSFFARDGVVGLVFTIWFLGVAQQQWGNDAMISLSAIVALILSAAIAALGFILALESHRPSLTAQITNGRGKVNFFRKSEKSPSGELP